jgi:hypothetical protein
MPTKTLRPHPGGNRKPLGTQPYMTQPRPIHPKIERRWKRSILANVCRCGQCGVCKVFRRQREKLERQYKSLAATRTV